MLSSGTAFVAGLFGPSPPLMSAVLTSSPSGLPSVDQQWGGLDAGSTYLLVGRAGAGRSALALQAVQATVASGSTCLLLSPRPPAELVEIGRGIAFDLAEAHGAGLLRPLRIPTAADLAEKGTDGLETAYRDLVALVRAERPARVVVEDFTPLVQFDSFERLDEAFQELTSDLRALGTTLVVGLGAPANDASRQLLDVVRRAADGMVQIQDDGDLVLDPAPEADPFATEPVGEDRGGSLLSDVEFFQSTGDESATSESADPFATDEETGIGGETTAEVAVEVEPETADEAATAEGDEAPVHDADAVEGGADADEEAEGGADAETETSEAEPDETEPPEAATQAAAPPEAAPPEAAVVPPPPVDPALLYPNDDPFGNDPADALMEQGYLADSQAGDAGTRLEEPATSAFAPPTAPPPSPDAAFRQALDRAFQTRSAGVPFLIVAARMQPGTPEAAYFPNVTAALRSALPDAAHLLANDARKRVIVLLTMSGPEAGQALFADLQTGLRQAVGDDAEATLQAISAVTIPDAQPFASPSDLMAYAFDG